MKPYLLYYQNNSIQNLNNLEELFNALDQAKINPDGPLQDILGYTALILSGLKDIEAKTLSDVYVTFLLGFIDSVLLQNVISNPNEATPADLNELGTQLFYVAVAMGLIEDIEPYPPEEFAAVVDGKAPLHETFVLVTLGYILLNPEQAYAPTLTRMVAQNFDQNLTEEYEWIDALISGLLMQIIWEYFSFLSNKDKQYILQRYFYRAIVSGVPVRDWLTKVYENNLDNGAVSMLIQPLLSSLEIVPTTPNLTATKKFGDIVKEFITVISREQISTLAQEQYLNKWYQNTATGQLFRSWLRESLNTVYRIQTNTLK